MGPKYGPVALLLGVLTLQVSAYISDKSDSKEDVTPMVAFMCNKPTMHMTSDGWKKDDTTDCLSEPWEILVYCKKMYPKLDITNIVEASEKVTIENWCRHGHERCHHHGSHTVRPYRCLEGPFQSDALLVPEHCVFDHIHRSSECKSFDAWNSTASESCKERGMVQQSFAILLPCKVDRFSGVEFVCCPKSKELNEVPQKPKPTSLDSATEEKSSSEEDDYSEEDDSDYSEEDWYDEDEDEDEDEEDDLDDDWEGDWEDEDDWEDSSEERDSKEESEETVKDLSMSKSDENDLFGTGKYSEEESKESKEVKVLPTEHLPKDQEDVKPTDVYTEYLHKPSQFVNEHQYFLKAKSDLQKHHHEKVTKMMKEWAAARQRVQEMKSTDPKAADKLNKDITTRFQKTYQALEQEGMAEKQQLVALHQQRVQAELNEKKRHAMEHYMAALQKNQPDAAQILKSLQHYVKAEQKDRMHTINHFEHLRDTDPHEAKRVRQETLDHLAIIDQRIHQAIEMLNRVPQFAKKVKLQIGDFLKTFQEIDASISSILSKPVEEDSVEDIDDVIRPTKDEPTEKPKPKSSIEPEDEEIDMGPPQPMEIHHVPLMKESQPLGATKYDDEVREDERVEPYMEVKPAAHQQLDEFSADQNYIHKQHMRPSAQSLPAMGIAIGSIAVFVIIVVGIVVLRKRAQRVPVNHGFVEVDQAVSPEERHVANMQMNGYENPTYKYFEMNGNA
jgi:phage host-nuclease inhibitor protein Gam